MQIIKSGAEAIIYEDTFCNIPIIVKERIPKNYRNIILDSFLRKERLRREANILRKARKFVNTPYVYLIDLVMSKLFIEKINGILLKEYLNSSNLEIMTRIGKLVRELHKQNIIHGDLTTSNIIISNEKEIVFFDFGLGFNSNKIEDKAVDLLNFKKILNATHSVFENCWELFEKGYSEMDSNSKDILTHVQKVDSRRRYG